MPIIDVSIAAGRTPEQLRDFVHALNEAAARTVDALPENTVVLIREVAHEHWAKGDVTIAERLATASGTTETPTKE